MRPERACLRNNERRQTGVDGSAYAGRLAKGRARLVAFTVVAPGGSVITDKIEGRVCVEETLLVEARARSPIFARRRIGRV